MKQHKRHSGLFRGAVSVALSVIIPFTTMPEVALALPHGGHVTKGTATLSYATNKLLVNQSTSSASFSWSGFNVGSAQSVTYKTPGASSVSMNFIGGTTPAVISGKVTSNGVLYFMDANGLVFGSGSTVSASGVRAYGAATPGGSLTGTVSNAGTIEASPGGTVALIGSQVTNSGTITAPSGQVILASGDTVTLSDTGSSSLSVATTGGGNVTDSGVISAENVDGTPGTIVAKAGMTSGTVTLASAAVLDASAPTGGNGGNITVDAYMLVLEETAPFDVSAPSGTPGTVTIDPTMTSVGTAAGLNIIDRSQSSYLSNTIDLLSSINMADGTLSNGTSLYNWTPLGSSGGASAFTGTFNGNGYVVSGYTVGTNNSSYPGNYAGFVGYSRGTIENLGVTGAVYGSVNDVGGLVGYNNGGTITNSYATGSVSVSGNSYSNVGGLVGKNSGSITGSHYATGSVTGTGSYFGSLVGVNLSGGTISKSYATGSVGGSSSIAGGLVGENFGSIMNSYATGSVSGSTDGGGLVGVNVDGSITYTYATGSVSNGGYAGGLAGGNGGTIKDSYWDTTTSGQKTSYGGKGLTTPQFASFGNFSGFSPSVWQEGTITTNGSRMSAPVFVAAIGPAVLTTIRFTPPIDSLYPMETSLPFTGFASNIDLSPPTVRSGSGLVENTTSPFPGNGAIILISDETSETPASPEPQAMVKKDPLKNDVYFAFDKALLTPEDKMILKKDASILKTHPEENLIIEGHADERGTDTYNIVLGQKRAQATKLYLIRLGVSVNRIKIVSYGKREIPDLRTCSGHSESCWSKNRLVHLR